MFPGFTTIGEGGKEKETSSEEMISSFIQDILKSKTGKTCNEDDLRKVVNYLKSLPDIDKEVELLDISFDVSITLGKRGRKKGEQEAITFQVVIEKGKYSLIPKNSVSRGFTLLEQLEKE